jgi:hypothetical protein
VSVGLSLFVTHTLVVSSAYERNDLGGLRHQAMRELFIVLDQVANVDVAVVFLDEGILLELISAMGTCQHGRHTETLYVLIHLPVDKVVVETELEHKVFEVSLGLDARVIAVLVVVVVDMGRVDRLLIHLDGGCRSVSRCDES